MSRTAKSIALVQGVTSSFVTFGRDIKLAHSVFALPFALAALFLAPIALPSPEQFLLLLICMVCARCFAMGINRSLDSDIDALNPRTQSRMIPSGAIARRQSVVWSWVFGTLFIIAAFSLNVTAGVLAFPTLMVLAGYTLTKRFSWLCHWYLGMCLGFAPIAAYIALGYDVPYAVLALGLAVAAWTAGFDIIYSLQDIKFDRKHQLHSIPAMFGPRRALWISRISFVVMIACLQAAGLFADAGVIYFIGVAAVAGVLLYEHWLVRDAASHPDGHSKNINAAFFNLNAFVSFFYLIFVFTDALVRTYV